MSTQPPVDPSVQAATLQSAIDELTAQEAAEDTVITSVLAYIAGVPAQISAAVAAASQTGATPAQLSQITNLGKTIAADTVKMQAALAAPVPPPSA